MLPNWLVATSVVGVPVSTILSLEPEIGVAVYTVIVATVDDMPLSLTGVVCTSPVCPLTTEDVAVEIVSGDIDEVGLEVPVETTVSDFHEIFHGNLPNHPYSSRNFVQYQMGFESYLKPSSPFTVSSDAFTDVAVFSTFTEEHRSAVNEIV